MKIPEIPLPPKAGTIVDDHTDDTFPPLGGSGIGVRQISLKDAGTIESIARESWRHGYALVLPQEQIDFMLQKSYSESGIREAMQRGEQFFLLESEGVPVGFISLFAKTQDILRIEKIYLLPKVQGRGFGKKLIDFAVAQAKESNRSVVELNVNRGNKAYHFYLKQGFRVVREVDIPYFGFVLDDYVMQKQVFSTPTER